MLSFSFSLYICLYLCVYFYMYIFIYISMRRSSVFGFLGSLLLNLGKVRKRVAKYRGREDKEAWERLKKREREKESVFNPKWREPGNGKLAWLCCILFLSWCMTLFCHIWSIILLPLGLSLVGPIIFKYIPISITHVGPIQKTKKTYVGPTIFYNY